MRPRPLLLLSLLVACRTSGMVAGATDGTSSTGTTASTVSTTSEGSTASPDGSETSSEASGTSESGGSACPEPAPECLAAQPGTLQDVTGTPASPYLVRHPSRADAGTDTVVFFPGGGGSIDTAQPTYDLWLANGAGIDDFRVVVPYAQDGDFTDEGDRALSIIDELAACYCGSGRVHLGGTSLGGRNAYATVLRHPDRFVTLLGAPGTFDAPDPRALAVLRGYSVLNAVGELDDGWQGGVEATHQALLDAGVDSSILVMAGQSHILDPDFDESVFFEFWSTH